MHSRFGYESKDKAKIALNYRSVCEYNRTVEDPEKRMCKMAFDRETVTLPRFVKLATSGYAFCNLFRYDRDRLYRMKSGAFWNRCKAEYQRGRNKGAMKMQFKSRDYYEGSQCFFVDVDYTQYDDVGKYVEDLALKPTVVYLSFSDNTYKLDKAQQNNPRYDHLKGICSRRFRLCYVFDEIVYGEENFGRISNAINKMVGESTHEPVQDECGKQMTQYFNGSTNKEVYVTGIIYELSDFGIDTDNMPQITSTPSTSYDESPQEGQFDPTRQISHWLIKVLESNDYDYVMQHYRHKYAYIYRKDDGIWVNRCQSISDDYFALPYYSVKLKDGEKRRKILYDRMCLRRIMVPSITPDEVLFNAYEDLHRFIDNTDGVITIDCLVSNVQSAFGLNICKLRQQYINTLQYLQSKNPSRGIIYDLKGAIDQGKRNRMMKEIRWGMIDQTYDKDLTPEENATKLGYSLKTIRRYCQYRGIESKRGVSNEYLMRLIDDKLSVRKNIAYLKKEYGIRISKDRVSRLLHITQGTTG